MYTNRIFNFCSLNQNQSQVITWTFLYTAYEKQWVSTAYTYVYAPCLGQVGTQGAFKYKTSLGSEPVLAAFPFIVGIHEAKGGTATSLLTATAGANMSPLVPGWGGTIVTYTFRVAEDAPAGETPITLTYDAGSTYNKDLQLVYFDIEDGAVNIIERIAADVSGDGVIDMKDVTYLRRWIAGGWNIDIVAKNADVNGDNMVNLMDVALITRYLVGGWGVDLI